MTSVGPVLLWGRHCRANVGLIVLLWRVLPTHHSQGGQSSYTKHTEKTVCLDSVGVSGLSRI